MSMLGICKCIFASLKNISYSFPYHQPKVFRVTQKIKNFFCSYRNIPSGKTQNCFLYGNLSASCVYLLLNDLSRCFLSFGYNNKRMDKGTGPNLSLSPATKNIISDISPILKLNCISECFFGGLSFYPFSSHKNMGGYVV